MSYGPNPFNSLWDALSVSNRFQPSSLSSTTYQLYSFSPSFTFSPILFVLLVWNFGVKYLHYVTLKGLLRGKYIFKASYWPVTSLTPHCITHYSDVTFSKKTPLDWESQFPLGALTPLMVSFLHFHCFVFFQNIPSRQARTMLSLSLELHSPVQCWTGICIICQVSLFACILCGLQGHRYKGTRVDK